MIQSRCISIEKMMIFKILISNKFSIDRENSIINKEKWLMTLDYCRKNVMLAVTFVAFSIVNFLIIIFGLFIFPSNKYRLPLNCYIFNVDNSTAKWAVDYILQCLILTFGSIFFVSHFIMMLILLDQSSWIIEVAILKVNKLNHIISKENSRITDYIKEIVDEISDVIQRLDVKRKFFRKFFLADFTIIAVSLCLYFYSMIIGSSTDFQSSAFLNMELVLCFLLCAMGSKLNSKLTQLSAAIYAQNWHMMSVRYKKDLKVILQMSQKIKGFDGVFKPVDLATFQQVWMDYF